MSEGSALKIIVAILLAAVPLFAQADEVFDFKGLKLGSSEKQLKSTLRGVFCQNDTLIDRLCETSKVSFAGTTHPVIVTQLMDDRIYTINITYPAAEFYQVITALIEKYGESQSVTKKPLITGFGVHYENEIYTWKKGASTLIAKKYWSQVDLSSVNYSLDDYQEYLGKRTTQDTKKNANDL